MCSLLSWASLDLSDDLRGGSPHAGGAGGMRYPVLHFLSSGLKAYYHRYKGLHFSKNVILIIN